MSLKKIKGILRRTLPVEIYDINTGKRFNTKKLSKISEQTDIYCEIITRAGIRRK